MDPIEVYLTFVRETKNAYRYEVEEEITAVPYVKAFYIAKTHSSEPPSRIRITVEDNSNDEEEG